MPRLAVPLAGLLAGLACACSTAPTRPLAERELEVGAQGRIRVAIGDPREVDGAWASAEVIDGELTITTLEALCFLDADGDGHVGPGESRSSASRTQAGSLQRRIWLLLGDRAPGEGCDAVRVRLDTSAGGAAVVIPLPAR